MAAPTAIGIYDILGKISATSGILPTALSLDDKLNKHLTDLDLVEVLSYLATYYGYASQTICEQITGSSTIEDLYEWFMAQQEAAGISAKAYDAAEDREALFTAHEKLIRFHRNKWHLQEAIAILEAVKQRRQNTVDAKRAAYAKEKRGCTTEATVLTLVLMIPAALFLGDTARKVVLGLLGLHLLCSLIFKIWGLNGADCKKREAEIAQLVQKVQETQQQISQVQSELQALA